MKTANLSVISLAAIVAAVAFWSVGGATAAEKDAHAYNRLLGRGLNLGNSLESPKEGEWGVKILPDDMALIKKAGFDSVRLPIRWSTHAEAKAPFTIDKAFFARVDEIVAQALAQDLAIIVNIHHYSEMETQPVEHHERFLALWEQIAARYAKQPDRVFFEILNEPHSKMTAELWNKILAEALAIIRKTNPDRPVIIGPVQWNSISHLKLLELPKNDRRIIGTFHYYQPFQFTHQGAHWTKGSDQWLGKTWTATAEETAAMAKDLDTAAAWSKEHNRPLLMGEFGAFSKAPMDSRVRWTNHLREQAEARGFSWAYWEFASGFSVYDREKKQWRGPLLEALIPPSK